MQLAKMSTASALARIVLRQSRRSINPELMANLRPYLTALGAILAGPILAQTPIAPPAAPRPVPNAAAIPAPIEPPVDTGAPRVIAPAPNIAPAGGVTPPGGTLSPGAPGAPGDAATATEPEVINPNATRMYEFQGDEVGLVLRTLARQAGLGVIVSEKVTGTVTMRLPDKTPREAIDIIVKAKGLSIDEEKGVFFIRTAEERAKEPTEAGSYTFSYASAEKIVPLLDKQLTSGLPSQQDTRTNTIFFRETRSNMDKIMLFLQTVDKPTEQVMIEARLVEVTANPQQSYGINWGGVVGSASTPQVFRYGGSAPNPTSATQNFPQPVVTTPSTSTTAGVTQNASTTQSIATDLTTGIANPYSLVFGGNGSNLGHLLGGQFAILSAPSMAVTLRFLNEDSDAEFLANPRVVTANNQKAEIKITRAQPVPQLNFNEQTAQAVFSGFQDKEFGNTLEVTPVINKENFVSLTVKPEISNKVGDLTFTFGSGASITSPIIDKRTLDSNVLIKSGDTLAIGGLLQDEVTKGRSKVPVLGDIPIIGSAFQEHVNNRTKRNLLVFVTPTIIKQGYGTGLEDQVSGLHNSGDEYADPNGWRNNAKGAVRLVPTSNRQVAADYPKPGVPPQPKKKRKVTTEVITDDQPK